ncbi:MAG: beta-lactamase family protein [Mycobacterium sp.]|nr:beta-lactamase family protein [Mycobacterium sp.]
MRANNLHVGRIGALAITLGIGSAVAVGLAASASADTGDAESGQTAATSRGAESGNPAGRPVAAKSLTRASSAQQVAARSTPAAASAAASRRQSVAVTAPTASSTASVSTASAWAPEQPGSILRAFVGDGTADNPNAGILWGNGYSYTAYAGACTSGACNGGSGGVVGNGGDGFAGGNGGAAGWFGTGGAGGSATTAGGAGGKGGSGGLFFGGGGAGGAGADAVAGNGGSGGDGGDAGMLSVFGTGGIGGPGGAGAGGGRTGQSGSGGRSGIFAQPVFGVPPANLTSEAAPGLVWPAPTAIDLFLKAAAGLGLQSGYVAMFARDGQVVYSTTAGYADIASGAPMELDTRFRIASMTKPVTAVAAMILIEEGRLGLDDPVSRYIPAAADLRVATSESAAPDGTIATVALDSPLTVRDLLMFSSGIGSAGDIYAGSGSLESRIDRLMTVPLYEQPGTQWRYGYSADVLARVVEVASGEAFGEFVVDRILEPLGMASTSYLAAGSDRDGLATMYTQDAGGRLVAVDQPRGDSLDWTPGGSGLVSTAGDYMRFALMLWNGGTYQGTQILKPETVTLMTRPAVQSGVLADEGIDGLGWGLGMAVVVDADATSTFDRTGDFWWSGTYGTTFFVSPSTGLVGIVLSQNQTGPYSPIPYAIYLTPALAFLGL